MKATTFLLPDSQQWMMPRMKMKTKNRNQQPRAITRVRPKFPRSPNLRMVKVK